MSCACPRCSRVPTAPTATGRCPSPRRWRGGGKRSSTRCGAFVRTWSSSTGTRSARPVSFARDWSWHRGGAPRWCSVFATCWTSPTWWPRSWRAGGGTASSSSTTASSSMARRCSWTTKPSTGCRSGRSTAVGWWRGRPGPPLASAGCSPLRPAAAETAHRCSGSDPGSSSCGPRGAGSWPRGRTRCGRRGSPPMPAVAASASSTGCRPASRCFHAPRRSSVWPATTRRSKHWPPAAGRSWCRAVARDGNRPSEPGGSRPSVWPMWSTRAPTRRRSTGSSTAIREATPAQLHEAGISLEGARRAAELVVELAAKRSRR